MVTDIASVWRASAWDWTVMCPLEPEKDLRLEDSTAMAAWEAVVEEKRGDPATIEGSSLRNNIECSPRYNCLISSFVSGRSPVTGCFLCGGSDIPF